MPEKVVFPRGSSVLDYWLVHSEGMTVQPLDAIVERVVATPPVGRAERLIVRPRGSRRTQEIPVDAIAAVEPAAGRLFLEKLGPGRARRAARLGGTIGLELARDLGAGAAVLLRLELAGASLLVRGARAAIESGRQRRPVSRR